MSTSTRYGVMTDYDYTATHKRERLTIWSGSFSSIHEGEAFTLPKLDGYMVTTYNGDKIRVACPAPRRDDNFLVIDAAISDALVAFYAEPVNYAATAGNNRRVHLVRETHDDHNLTLCGVRTPRRPQTTQQQLPKCRRCF